jgi:hypothetical protein
MTEEECQELIIRWEIKECYNTAPNACPIPSKPVWWVGFGCNSNIRGNKHNGCMVWFDCYQFICAKDCNQLNSVGCYWKNNQCVYLPTGL